MTAEEAQEWALRQLGGDVVRIELRRQHVVDCWNNTVRWWIARRGVKRHAVVQTTPGISEYAMPGDCDQVIQVWFPGGRFDVIAAVNPYAFLDVDMLPVAFSTVTGVPGGQFYSTLHQILSHAETARRVMGAEPDWEYDKEHNTVRIFPANQRAGTVVARYASTRFVAEDPVPPATFPKNDLREIRFRDRDILLRYLLADLKGVLGRIRAKYVDGMPSAGGTKTMDGDSLMGESQSEKEALTEELLGLSDPIPFITG